MLYPRSWSWTPGHLQGSRFDCITTKPDKNTDNNLVFITLLLCSYNMNESAVC